MQFLKNHYEKLILSLVLIGLAAAAVVLMMKVGGIKDDLEKVSLTRSSGSGTPLQPLERDTLSAKLELAKNPLAVDLGHPNLVFNPVVWKKTASDSVFPDRDGKSTGEGAVEVTSIVAKNLIIELVRVTGTEERPRYEFGITAEGAPERKNQRQKKKGVYAGDTGEYRNYPESGTNFVFTLKEVQGAALEPTSLILEVEGEEMPVVITPDEPFKKVMLHVANMVHRQTREQYVQKTKGDSIVIEGEVFNIIAVSATQVVIESASGKRSYKEFSNNGVSEQ